MEILRKADCDIVQGFYYSKPVSFEEATKLLINGFIQDAPPKNISYN